MNQMTFFMYIVAVYCMLVGYNGFPANRLLYPRQWAEEQAMHLKAKRFEVADISGLVEELMDMAKNPASAVKNQLVRLLIHLLKHMCNPHHLTSSWNRTIDDARYEIELHLDDQPLLNSTHQGLNSLDEALNWAWNQVIRRRDGQLAYAVYRASSKTIQVKKIPDECPWTVEEVLNEDFFPNLDDYAEILCGPIKN